MGPKVVFQPTQANAARWARPEERETTLRTRKRARTAKFTPKVEQLGEMVTQKDGESRWVADDDPALLGVIGKALRNTCRRKGGTRYSISEVGALFGVVSRGPEDSRRSDRFARWGLTVCC
jgi:hypothetical protein